MHEARKQLRQVPTGMGGCMVLLVLVASELERCLKLSLSVKTGTVTRYTADVRVVGRSDNPAV